MARKVEVIPYDPTWPTVYAVEAEIIKGVLGSNVIAVHHIGSTSIPGIAAKPTIDVLVVDRDHGHLDACNDAMRDLGYQPKGDNGIPGRRYFQKLAGEVHLFHIHAFEESHPDIARHLNFRDYLRAHPEEARAYQDLKLRLAARFAFKPTRYTSGKSDFILTLDRRAAAWRAKKNDPKDRV